MQSAHSLRGSRAELSGGSSRRREGGEESPLSFHSTHSVLPDSVLLCFALLLSQWNCSKCSFHNKGASKSCEMCNEAKPAAASSLTLSITIPSHATYSHTPLLLDAQKPNLQYGFLRDILEAKSGIKDAKMLLFFRDALVDGEPSERVVDVCIGCNPNDVLALTLQNADLFAGDIRSSLPALPRSSPTLGKKKSSGGGGSKRTMGGAPGGPPGGLSGLDRQNSNDSTGGLSRQNSKGGKGPGRKASPDAAAMGDDDEAGWGDAGEGEEAGWGEDDDGGWGGEDGVEDDEDGDGEEQKSGGSKPAAKAATSAASSSSSAAAASSSSSAAAAAVPGSSMDSYSSSYESVYARTAAYILRKPSQLDQHVSVLMADLGELLGITADEAGILMRGAKERWNRVRIEDAWMNDSDKLRLEAGLGPEPSGDSSEDPTRMVECETCCDEIPANKSYALNCNHRFCGQDSAPRPRSGDSLPARRAGSSLALRVFANVRAQTPAGRIGSWRSSTRSVAHIAATRRSSRRSPPPVIDSLMLRSLLCVSRVLRASPLVAKASSVVWCCPRLCR